MKTLPKQTSQSGTARSMFSQEDSPANLSPSLAEERERTITATSGHRCFERYGRYTPLGSLVKTLLASRRWWSPAKSLRWDAQTIFSKRITYTERKADSPSTKSVQTSKPKDIPSNRLLFQLVPSEHHTEGIESGLLQEEFRQLLLTPTAVMIAEDPKNFKERAKKNGYQNGTTYGSLASQVMYSDMLPTPNAMDIPHKDMEINERGRINPKKGKTDHSLGLEDMAVAQFLPTPTALDKGGGRINKSLSPNAAERPTLAVNGLLLTPSATDGLRSTMTMDSLKSHNKENANLAEQIAHKVGGGTSQLNPLFVEEMMGFPLMWTALPFLSPSGDKNP